MGKHQFEQALQELGPAEEVSITYRSFELQPDATPFDGELLPAKLAKRFGRSESEIASMHERVEKMGAEVGVTFDFAIAKPANTHDAHRLIHLAAEDGRDQEMFEALHEAYFMKGQDIGSHEVLVEIGSALGYAPEEVQSLLSSDDYRKEVIDDEREAEELGITGVPFFVIDREYGVSGAQGVETFRSILGQIAARENSSQPTT